MKKSNLLLLGFYLTLLSCFITYLVFANSYIIENYSIQSSQNQADEKQTKFIDRPIHHLIVRNSINLRGLAIGSVSRITYHTYENSLEGDGILITGDTLIFNNYVALSELHLEHKLKSIQFENCDAEIYSTWLQPDASIVLVGSNEESNIFFCEGEDISSIRCKLIGSHLAFHQNSYNPMSIDSVEVDLHNSHVDFIATGDYIRSKFQVNSYTRFDRITASSELLSKMKLINDHYEDAKK